jgi:hypothetical protein
MNAPEANPFTRVWTAPLAPWSRVPLTGKEVHRIQLPSEGGEIPGAIVDSGGTVRELELREIDVCDSGTPKKMLVLGSEPYTP